jgi:hypothetical protein
VDRDGPFSKQKRLENVYPDSACGYTSPTGEHSDNEWEVVSPKASPQKNKLPRLKLRKTGASRPMQAALRLNVPDGARSGFERAGGFADETEMIARLESRAVTLRNLGLAPIIPQPLLNNTPPEPLRTQTAASVQPSSPISISDDASSAEEDEPPVVNVTNHQEDAVRTVTTAVTYLHRRSHNQAVILLPNGRGDRALIRRMPSVPFDVPIFRFDIEEFERFAAQRHISLEGININELRDEIAKRVNVLTRRLDGTDVVWEPLRRPVYRKYSRELIALMTLTLHLFGRSELALMLIYCISKYKKSTLHNLMNEIFSGRYRY